MNSDWMGLLWTMLVAVVSFLAAGIAWKARTQSKLDSLEVCSDKAARDIATLNQKSDDLSAEVASLTRGQADIMDKIREFDRELNQHVSKEILEITLGKQTSDLIIQMRNLLHVAKKEWGDEAARATTTIVHEYLREWSKKDRD